MFRRHRNHLCEWVQSDAPSKDKDALWKAKVTGGMVVTFRCKCGKTRSSVWAKDYSWSLPTS